MNKKTNNNFEAMAKKIYINPQEEVLVYIQKEKEELDLNLSLLREIDTENVEPMTRICPKINYLREDVVEENFYLEKSEVLNNAKEKDDNYVIMKRIIK